jgi:quercetin dioxygenase-like cupin family protein
MSQRIVTGHDRDGKSVILDQLSVPTTFVFKHIRHFEVARVWATSASPAIPRDHADPAASLTSVLPVVGGTVCMKVTFPPDAIMAEDAGKPEALAEQGANLPGLAERFEPDAPGMHTTDSVDYGVLLDGELWLEVDGGADRCIKPGDIVIQNGTRHAWRNRSDRPATMFFVLIGASRT